MLHRQYSTLHTQHSCSYSASYRTYICRYSTRSNYVYTLLIYIQTYSIYHTGSKVMIHILKLQLTRIVPPVCSLNLDNSKLWTSLLGSRATGGTSVMAATVKLDYRKWEMCHMITCDIMWPNSMTHSQAVQILLGVSLTQFFGIRLQKSVSLSLYIQQTTVCGYTDQWSITLDHPYSGNSPCALSYIHTLRGNEAIPLLHYSCTAWPLSMIALFCWPWHKPNVNIYKVKWAHYKL